ncbi:MAG: NAD(P)/FAD-dependent oxidoreductase [Bacteroidota bacterium]
MAPLTTASSFDHQLAVIGTGFGGLAMAIRLKAEGMEDFVLLEGAEGVGGTWRENTYPGCACDIPSQLYSFSFAPNPDWTRAFPSQPEILAYLRNCVAHYKLTPYIRYQSKVQQLAFDAELGGWRIQLEGRPPMKVRMVVVATGQLSRPSVPALTGLEDFAGRSFHSARWPEDIDLRGKRVAVVGTGASAIQIVPSIVEQVEQLDLYQRTPPWVMPRPDRPISSLEKWLFKKLPFTQALSRHLIYWRLEATIGGFTGQHWITKIAEQAARLHLKRQVPDLELRQALRPSYQMGCKRVLVSNDYYPALLRPNARLITEGLDRIKSHHMVLKNGEERATDVLILATGFRAADFLTGIRIKGLGGRELMDDWASKGPEAYYGITVSGYPNLCFMMGPNTNLGHNSIIHMLESQANYILEYWKIVQKGPKRMLNLKAEVQQSFNQRLQKRLRRSIWQQGGCASWYQNAEGRNTLMWPGSTVAYRWQTRRARPEDYQLEP